MAVPQDLLDILVCPVCKAPLKLVENREKAQEENRGTQSQPRSTEKAEQGLKCSACRRVYPIRNDIPVMIVDEARVDPA